MRRDDTVIVSMSKRVRYQMVAKKKTKRREVEGVCYVFVCASSGRRSVARTVNNFHENEWSQRGHRAECYSGK